MLYNCLNLWYWCNTHNSQSEARDFIQLKRKLFLYRYMCWGQHGCASTSFHADHFSFICHCHSIAYSIQYIGNQREGFKANKVDSFRKLPPLYSSESLPCHVAAPLGISVSGILSTRESPTLFLLSNSLVGYLLGIISTMQYICVFHSVTNIEQFSALRL